MEISNFTPAQWYILAMCVFAVLILALLVAVFRSSSNKVQCYQLISSMNQKGEERADIDKLAKVVALLLMAGLVPYIVVVNKVEWTPVMILGLLTLFLAYAGSMSSIAAYLRSKQATTTVLPDPLPEVKP